MRMDYGGMRKTRSGPGKHVTYYPPDAFGGPDIVWRRRYGKKIENTKRRKVS